MSGYTVSNLINAACDGAKVPRPTLIVSATDTYDRQLVALFQETLRELRGDRCWGQLKREHVFQLEPFRRKYQLPIDFYTILPLTAWDRQNNWTMRQSSSDGEFVCQVLGYAGAIASKTFRIIGPDLNRNSGEGQFQLDPVPDANSAGQLASFEYISKNFIIPADWAASTAYTTADYVSCGGRVYKCSSNGTSGTVPPTMILGRGQSGSAFLTALSVSAWGATTYYQPFDYVTNGGNLYRCTVGGQSAGAGGPTGTDTDTAVTDNTVSWLYISTSAWVGLHAYSFDDHVTQGGVYYRCTGAGTSGKNAPTWTTTTITDNTAQFQDYRTLWWEDIAFTTDQCLFDPGLVIAGLKWRFKAARGLEFQAEFQTYENMKAAAAARFSGPSSINLADCSESYSTSPTILDGNWGTA